MMVENKSISERIFTICNVTFLLLLALSCVLPMVHMIAISLSDPEAVMRNQVSLIPNGFTTNAYKIVLTLQSFYQGFENSILRAVVGTIVNMFLTLITAYAIAQEPEKFKGRMVILWFLIIPMLFGGGLIPTYLLIKNLHLIDNFWVLILPGAIPVWNVIMMMNFFRGIPKSLSESALMDGATHWHILFQIFIPLSLAGIATLSLFCLVGHWNYWFDALIYLRDPSKWPVQTVLRSLLVSNRLDTNVFHGSTEALRKFLNQQTMTATFVVLVTIPILLIYPFLQKYFAKGIVVGSVKE